MNSTKETYEMYKERLMAKHPRLREMTSVPLDEAGLDFESLSDFIEVCWTHDYGKKPRFRFSREFLEWNMANRLTGKAIRNADRELVGVILYFRRAYISGGKKRHYTIETGLSVRPGYRGQGIAQWLFLDLKQTIQAEGYDFSLMWYDNRQAHSGSAFKTFAESKTRTDNIVSVAFLWRVFNPVATVRHADLSVYEQLGLRLISLVFPYPVSYQLPDGFELAEWRQDRAPDYADFLAGVITGRDAGLLPDAGMFLRWRHKGGFFALTEGGVRGKIRGLYFGHKVALGKGWSYFQADGILVSPDLPRAAVRGFLRAVEVRLGEKESCTGVSVAQTGCSRGLWRYGYLPMTHQLLAVDSHGTTILSPGQLKAGFVELR